MNTVFYTGDQKNWRTEAALVDLPKPPLDEMNDPAGYLPDPGLRDAVNVALMLGQPLLVTGETGTGKTQLAYNVAKELGLKAPLKFEVRSTTTATDLFYVFDTLRQFRDARAQSDLDVKKYIEFNALGLAILLANPWDKVADVWPKNSDRPFDGPRRSVVLIDEIDKAPRDVPNDILNDIELMHFRIVEANNRMVQAPQELHPVLILTSNSEKHLPDAFLRRCVYYDIPFPDPVRLQEIVARRIEDYKIGCPLLDEATALFGKLRAPVRGMRKPPGTAELLNWLYVLRQCGLSASDSLRNNEEKLLWSLSTLSKTREDQLTASRVVTAWLAGEDEKA
jgi:MoxR-like ATPase